MKVTSMNVSIPESLRAWVDEMVERQGYGTVSEYVRELIRNDQKRRATEALETALLEAVRSGTTELSAKDFEAIRDRIRRQE
jgi:antitoxin ParD1/3/4